MIWQKIFIWHLPCSYTSCWEASWHSHLDSEIVLFTVTRAWSLPLYPFFLKSSPTVVLDTPLIFISDRKHLHLKPLHWLIVFHLLSFSLNILVLQSNGPVSLSEVDIVNQQYIFPLSWLLVWLAFLLSPISSFFFFSSSLSDNLKISGSLPLGDS